MAQKRTHEEMTGQFGSHDLKLFESGDFSDAQVKCWHSTWKVHKAMLCQRSDWFKKAFNGGFRETREGVVNIKMFRSNEVEWMLKWLYSGSFAVKDIPNYNKTPYTAICNALTVADYFILKEPQKMLKEFLWAELSAEIETYQSGQSSQSKASKAAIKTVQNDPSPSDKAFLDKFFEGVHLLYDQGIYEDNPQHPIFRKMLVEFGIRVQSTMLATTGGNSVFLGHLRASPGFAVDLLVEGQGGAPHQIVSTTKIVCGECSKVIFQNGRHIARVLRNSGAKDLYTCSRCFEKKEKMLEI